MDHAAPIVLVHGAWHGGWVWRDVLPRLRAHGHAASAPTLTGLGERRHLGADTADLDTHIEDVVAHLEMEDLRGVTLVGWSYAGMVITGVAARVPERIGRLVYLDAFLPDDGKAAIDYLPPEYRQAFDACKAEGMAVPPPALDIFGVPDPRVAEFVTGRLTAQPWRTWYQPVQASPASRHIPVSYIVCTKFNPSPFLPRLPEIEARPDVRVRKLDTGHFCMVTALEETVALLSEG